MVMAVRNIPARDAVPEEEGRRRYRCAAGFNGITRCTFGRSRGAFAYLFVTTGKGKPGGGEEIWMPFVVVIVEEVTRVPGMTMTGLFRLSEVGRKRSRMVMRQRVPTTKARTSR